MKLDIELVRSLLEQIESVSPHDTFVSEDEVECYHLKQMIDGGLIEGWSQPDGFEPGWGAEISDLTMKGHAFLAHTRENKFWASLKQSLRDKGIALTVETVLQGTKALVGTLLGS